MTEQFLIYSCTDSLANELNIWQQLTYLPILDTCLMVKTCITFGEQFHLVRAQLMLGIMRSDTSTTDGQHFHQLLAISRKLFGEAHEELAVLLLKVVELEEYILHAITGLLVTFRVIFVTTFLIVDEASNK